VTLEVRNAVSSGVVGRFVNSSTNASDSRGIDIQCGPDSMTSGTAKFIVVKDNSGTERGGLFGSASGVYVYNYSDERVKAQIQPSACNARSVIQNISVIDYKMKRPDGQVAAEDQVQTGFSAQNLQQVYPKAVIHYQLDEDNPYRNVIGSDQALMVAPDVLIPVLVKNSQEQQAKIDMLEDQIQKLQEAVNKLSKK
jgi:hypothetical protein